MRHGSDNAAYTRLLTTLQPVFAVTRLVRPCLLLVIILDTGHVLLGLLYHTRKEAWQSRLQFRARAYPDFSRRTRWRKYGDVQAVAAWTQELGKEFAALATTLGATATLQLEFPLSATDAEIRQIVLASPLPTLLSAL